MSVTEVKPQLVTGPVRPLADEAEAIAAAHEAAAAIAAISADRAERRRIPYRQAEILSQSGLTTISVPRELGGIGASIATLTEAVRIVSTADGGVGQLLQIHYVMARGILSRGPSELRDRLIADLLAGKRLGNAGAEVGGRNKFDHKTRAVRNADGKWVVNGAKFYATGCFLAEWILTGAQTEEGPIGLLLHRDTPGLFLDDDWDAFGQVHSVSGGIRFEDLVVEDDAFVSHRQRDPAPAATGDGTPIRTGLTFPQILHAAIDTGIARGALDAATHYIRNHSNVWIDADVARAAEEPLIIKRIGEYAVAVRLAESLLRDAAELFDAYFASGQDPALQDELILAVATVRAQSDHASLHISSDMFSVLGASSSYRKFNLDRFWADARVHTTHDPIRWRQHHIGNYYLNGVPPDEYSAALARKAGSPDTVRAFARAT
jgi:alkylation response protein AidB-like acyl-CoA dehydrogenase